MSYLVPEQEKFYLDHSRLRLLALACNMSLRSVERRIGFHPGNLWNSVRRGWLRRAVADQIAKVLGCQPSDFELREGVRQ